MTTINNNDNGNNKDDMMNVDSVELNEEEKDEQSTEVIKTMIDDTDETTTAVEIVDNSEITATETEKSNEKCTIEVFSTELMHRPPPDYSLTSPCLPPNSPREQDWPPEPPPPFDGHPPYPAGPPLLRVAYPKDIPGPTYACPKCEGRFLYHRPSGIVQCPFCHSAISIGRYVRIRACSLIMFGLLFLLSSVSFAMINILFLDYSRPYFIAVSMIAILALFLLMRAIHMCSRYRETDRIEFT